MKSVFILLLFPLCLNAQPGLKNSNRIAELEAESRSLEDTDVKKGSRLAAEALQLAAGDTATTERLHGWIGHLKRFEAKYDSAILHLGLAIELSKETRSPLLASHLNELGLVHRQRGRLADAMKMHLDALAFSQDHGNQQQIGNSLYNIGFIFYMQSSYDTATSYFRRSGTIMQSAHDTVGIATSYNGIGLVLMRREIYDSSRNWFLKGISLIDEKKTPRVMAILYNNIGITYEDQDRYKESRDYYYRSLALKEKYNDLRGMASTYGNLADGFRQTKDFKEAIRHTRIGIDLAHQTNSVDYLMTAYKRLWLCYKETGDFQLALQNHETYKDLQDSLFNESKGRQINELMAQYAVAKKEKENAELKEAAILSQSKLSRQQIITFGIAAGLLVVVILLYVLYRYYTKAKSNEAALSIEKTKVDGINQQLQHVLTENENMVDVMVHDLRSPLIRVSGLADLVQREGGLSASQSTYLKMTDDVVNHGLKIIDDLFTINQKEALSIEKIDLRAFVSGVREQFTVEAGSKNIGLIFNAPDHPVVLSTDRESLQRILDNLLSNAIKFSPAGKSITLELGELNGSVGISVSDQGAGFSEEDKKWLYQKFKKLSARPTAGEPSTGLGLAIVKQLTEHIGAEIIMESNPGSGTKFTIVFPKG